MLGETPCREYYTCTVSSSDTRCFYLFQDIKDHCKKALSNVGADDDVCDFYADAMQYEYDMNAATYELKQSLAANSADGEGGPALIFKNIQNLIKCYNVWRSKVEGLTEKVMGLPSLQVDQGKMQHTKTMKSLCSVQTSQVSGRQSREI
ncbi:hypothetical protein LSAT2_016801 [Lamellibrachia satsuma]|nr:hypothetical protein LSAT2_016801 [Lamellibrachia satsuma]